MLAEYGVPAPIVVFECRCDATVVGESVSVTGDTLELGEWQPHAATELVTSSREFPLWRSRIFQLKSVAPQATIEFKFFISTKGQNVRWEMCSNRSIRCPQVGQLARVSASFGSDNQVTVSISEAAPCTNAMETTAADAPSSRAGNPPIVISSPPKNAIRNHFEALSSDFLDDASHFLPQEDQTSYVRYEWTDSVKRHLQLPDKLFPAMALRLIESNKSMPSLRQKLILIRTILLEASDTFLSTTAVASPVVAWRQSVHAQDLLIAFGLCSVYINWIATGALKCAEDGSHHRPNEVALVAKDIVDICERWRADIHNLRTGQDHLWEVDILEFFTRQVQPFLPSFDQSFVCAVPLTRIRDIAHRNDISQELKREIKTRLQNKLHRCAGPEDLLVCEELLNRFHCARHEYPPEFLGEFERFHGELRSFFNASDLMERLGKLNKESEENSRRSNAINRYFANRHTVDSQMGSLRDMKLIEALLLLVRSATQMREAFFEEIARRGFKTRKALGDIANASKPQQFFADDPAFGQSLRLADIQCETYVFTIFSQILNELEISHVSHENIEPQSSHKKMQVFTVLLCLFREGLRHIALSGFAVQSCVVLSREIRAALDSTYTSHAFFVMHLTSLARRILRMTQAFSDLLSVSLPSPVVERFGREMGVTAASAKVFVEGRIRASLVFQVSRAASLALRLCESETPSASPFSTICEGRAFGQLYVARHFSDIEFEPAYDLMPSVILFVHEATGDEEIEGLSARLSMQCGRKTKICGIILAHDLPALSHLGVRVRQARLPFMTISSPTFDIQAFIKSFDREVIALDTEQSPPVSIASAQQLEHPRHHESEALALTRKSSLLLRPRIVEMFKVYSGPDVTRETCGAKAAACEHLSALMMTGGGNPLRSCTAPRCLALPFGTFDASLHWGENAAVASEIHAIVLELGSLSGTDLSLSCEKLRQLIINGLELCSEAETELQKALLNTFYSSGSLSVSHTAPSFVMVRSSSNVEDLHGLSGAGLYDSLPARLPSFDISATEGLAGSLDVSELWLSIKTVWASLYSERAVLARKHAALRGASMAILLQPLVAAAWSFVVHTRCPPGICTGLKALERESEGWMYVELARGLGEALAGCGISLGGGRPTRLAVALDVTKEAVYEALWDMQGRYTASSEGKLEQVYTALKPVETQKDFWEAIVERLRPLKALETLFGSPQDVEGCLVNTDGNDHDWSSMQLYVLQSRPQVGAQ